MTVTDRFTIDTNILFYSIDPADERKHRIAVAVVEALLMTGTSLPLQVLGELARTVLRRKAMPVFALQSFIARYRQAFFVIPADVLDLQDALSAVEQHQMQFWDAMLWATARRAGCDVLLTEDGQSGQTIGGVLLLNPFLVPAHPRLRSLLGQQQDT